MRISRVFRIIFRIFILLLTLSITVVAFLGGWSAVLILQDTDNIGLGIDDAEFNLDYDLAGFHGGNFTLPFNITNAGYFDLENLEFSVSISLNYSHIDYPVPGSNETRNVIVFEKSENFGTIPKGQTGFFNFTANTSDFLPANFPDPLDVNLLRGPPVFEFYANITISLDYSLGMHQIALSIINLLIGELP